MSYTVVSSFHPEILQTTKILALLPVRFLCLCVHEAAVEKVRQMLKTHSIPIHSCETVSQWPGTVYSGISPVWELKIEITVSRIESLAVFLDLLLSDDFCRFYCDFSLQDENDHPWFIAVPHEGDYYFQLMDANYEEIYEVLQTAGITAPQ